jgi:hypothetical protein
MLVVLHKPCQMMVNHLYNFRKTNLAQSDTVNQSIPNHNKHLRTSVVLLQSSELFAVKSYKSIECKLMIIARIFIGIRIPIIQSINFSSML